MRHLFRHRKLPAHQSLRHSQCLVLSINESLAHNEHDMRNVHMLTKYEKTFTIHDQPETWNNAPCEVYKERGRRDVNTLTAKI